MGTDIKCRRAIAAGRATARMCLAGTVGLAITPAVPADDTAPSLLEEVVVTARKRVESLQTVPVSAAVVSGVSIQDNAVTSLQDLSETMPAITLSRGSTTERLFVRGVGSGDNPSFEQSVGTFVDDVYHGRARLSQGSLFDIERVEVLRGPQTTYFGNNAIAGAVNVASRSPGRDSGAEVRALYNATFDDYLFEGALDQRIGGAASMRLAGLVSGGDGWIEDHGARLDAPETDNVAVRGTLLWEPNEALSAKLKLQYVDERQKGGLPIVRRNCPPAASFGPPTGFCAAALASNAGPASAWFDRASSPGQSTDLASREAVATFSYDASGNTLTSVTAYTDYDYDLRSDLDTMPVHLFSIAAPEEYEQFSQELRFDSQRGGSFEYLLGVYYQSSRLTVENDLNYGFLGARIATLPAFAPLLAYLPFAQSIRFHSKDQASSAFGALTWHASSDLRATAALRYTRVEKDFDQRISYGQSAGNYGPVTPLPPAVAPLGNAFGAAGGLGVAGYIPLSCTDDKLSPSVSVEYDLSAGTMLYARYDNGFKAGGFNGVDTSGDASALPFAPEKVDAFELGSKSRLLGGRATLNLALFRSEYSDLQLAGVVPSTSGAYVNRVQNAGGAISQGVEVELEWEIDERWHTNLSLTALDATYTRYPNATPTAAQAQAGQRFQDLGNEPILFAPDLAGQWTVSWTRQIGSSLELIISNRLYASTGYFLGFSNDPYLEQPDYVRDDLSLTLASDRGWELSLICKNLGDELIRTYGAALPTSPGSYVFMTEPPRSVSVQAKLQF